MTLTDYIERALHRRVRIESREGVIRNARLTSIRTQDVETDQGTIRFPEHLILDGDEVDLFPVSQILRCRVID